MSFSGKHLKQDENLPTSIRNIHVEYTRTNIIHDSIKEKSYNNKSLLYKKKNDINYEHGHNVLAVFWN